LRVISGEAKGRRLKCRPGDRTRPTADKVKEALFSILGDVRRLKVLDLFSGSGALGIEALSRGAASCLFVEKDFRAVRVLRENLDLTGTRSRATVIRGDAVRVAEGLQQMFDLVLLDPPYFSPFIERLFIALEKLQAEGGVVVWERHFREPDVSYSPLKEKRYGLTVLGFYDLRKRK